MNARGSILITTLWIMAILSLLAMGIGFRASLEVRLSKYAMDKLEARYLAKAGIVKMRERILEDKKPYDTLYECGIKLDEDQTLEDVFGAEANRLGNGSFSVDILDEERKININMKNMTEGEYRNIMGRLTGSVFSELEEEGLPPQVNLITAILHWQGKAVSTAFEHGPEEHPYKPKKAEFEFIEELLLVKGVTRRMFDGIKDYVTVYGEGKMNVNTAPREVLIAIIPNPEIVDYIISGRNGSDKEEATDDDGWKNISAFTAYLGARIDNPAAYSKYFTVKSDNFRIISRGNAGRVETVITCVMDKKAAEKKEPFAYYHEE